MCCGQPLRRLDAEECKWLYDSFLAGDSKRLLCARFRIGADEFDRALAVGKAAGPWSPIPQLAAPAPSALERP